MHPFRRVYRMYTTDVRGDHLSGKLRKDTRVPRSSRSNSHSQRQTYRFRQSPSDFPAPAQPTQARKQQNKRRDMHSQSWFSHLFHCHLFDKKSTSPPRPQWRAEGNNHVRRRAAQHRSTRISPIRERSPPSFTVRYAHSQPGVIQRQPAARILTVEPKVQPARVPRAPRGPPPPFPVQSTRKTQLPGAFRTPRASSPVFERVPPRAGKRIFSTLNVEPSSPTFGAKRYRNSMPSSDFQHTNPTIEDRYPRPYQENRTPRCLRSSHSGADPLIETRYPYVVQDGYSRIQTSSKRILHDAQMRQNRRYTTIRPPREPGSNGKSVRFLVR